MGQSFRAAGGNDRVNVMFNYEPKSAYSSNGVRQFALEWIFRERKGSFAIWTYGSVR